MVTVKGAPNIKGLKFRRYQDPSDFSAMSTVSQRSWSADRFEWVQTEEDIATSYKGRDDRDPKKDILVVETEGSVVGYGEIVVEKIDDSTMYYWNSVHLLPEWRGQGIREAVFDFDEAELLSRARKNLVGGYLQAWACDLPNDWKSLLLSRGFEPSWDVLEMVRPDFKNMPDYRLPKDLEARPVSRQDLRQVWEGMKEAYRREPWYTDWKFDEAHYKQWIEDPSLAPELFQAAWEGDKIVGIVQNYIKREENEAFGRSRGHTERIYVVPSWQRMGVARALITRSLRMLKDMGMKDATLDVTAKNVSGALGLYMKLGYEKVNRFTFYRKSIPR